MRIRRLPDIVASLEADGVGKAVTGAQVWGPNSLKTLVQPDALVGDELTGAHVDGDKLVLAFTNHTVRVDLQRTGVLVWLKKAEPWNFGAPSAMPTFRVLLGDAGFDFTEPAKTKRIAVWIEQS